VKLPFTYFTNLEWYLELTYIISHHSFVWTLNVPFFYIVCFRSIFEKGEPKNIIFVSKNKLKDYTFNKELGPLKHFKRK